MVPFLKGVSTFLFFTLILTSCFEQGADQAGNSNLTNPQTKDSSPAPVLATPSAPVAPLAPIAPAPVVVVSSVPDPKAPVVATPVTPPSPVVTPDPVSPSPVAVTPVPVSGVGDLSFTQEDTIPPGNGMPTANAKILQALCHDTLGKTSDGSFNASRATVYGVGCWCIVKRYFQTGQIKPCDSPLALASSEVNQPLDAGGTNFNLANIYEAKTGRYTFSKYQVWKNVLKTAAEYGMTPSNSQFVLITGYEGANTTVDIQTDKKVLVIYRSYTNASLTFTGKVGNVVGVLKTAFHFSAKDGVNGIDSKLVQQYGTYDDDAGKFVPAIPYDFTKPGAFNMGWQEINSVRPDEAPWGSNYGGSDLWNDGGLRDWNMSFIQQALRAKIPGSYFGDYYIPTSIVVK